MSKEEAAEEEESEPNPIILVIWRVAALRVLRREMVTMMRTRMRIFGGKRERTNIPYKKII